MKLKLNNYVYINIYVYIRSWLIILDEIKILLSISDNLQDGVLEQLIKMTETQLKNVIGVTEVPRDLEYMVIEYVSYKFQILGNEATESVKTFEVSSKYINLTFYEYFKKDLDRYIKKNKIGQAKIVSF